MQSKHKAHGEQTGAQQRPRAPSARAQGNSALPPSASAKAIPEKAARWLALHALPQRKMYLSISGCNPSKGGGRAPWIAATGEKGDEQVNDSKLKQTLEAASPTTKVGRLRSVMPLLQAKLDAGVRLAVLVEIINAHGIEISKGTLQNYLHRYRKKAQDAAKPTASAAAGCAISTSGAPCSAPIATGETHCQPRPPALRAESLSLQELHHVMHPNPDEQAMEIQYYEELAYQRERAAPPL